MITKNTLLTLLDKQTTVGNSLPKLSELEMI